MTRVQAPPLAELRKHISNVLALQASEGLSNLARLHASLCSATVSSYKYLVQGGKCIVLYGRTLRGKDNNSNVTYNVKYLCGDGLGAVQGINNSVCEILYKFALGLLSP